jgi:tRNA G18 (ribose-2'-O)-methylase SpoU
MEENRNIIDHYWYWKTEDIKADLDTKRHNFSILCSNLYNDFNIATVIRNSNAFLAKEVIIYGSKRYDRRGTVGTHNYTNFKYFSDIEYESLKDHLKDSFVVGMDNIGEAVSIQEFKWPSNRHVVIALGQEQVGLPAEIIELCNKVVYIPQYGSVRSLNVGTASGIAMYDYCSKTLGNIHVNCFPCCEESFV